MAITFGSSARAMGITSPMSPTLRSPIPRAETHLLSLDTVGLASVSSLTTRESGHSTATLDGTWLQGF